MTKPDAFWHPSFALNPALSWVYIVYAQVFYLGFQVLPLAFEDLPLSFQVLPPTFEDLPSGFHILPPDFKDLRPLYNHFHLAREIFMMNPFGADSLKNLVLISQVGVNITFVGLY